MVNIQHDNVPNFSDVSLSVAFKTKKNKNCFFIFFFTYKAIRISKV